MLEANREPDRNAQVAHQDVGTAGRKLKALTGSEAKKFAAPAKGFKLYWCPLTPGFAVRVTSAGVRAWVVERRINGKTIRRTLGRVDGSGRSAISDGTARKLALQVSGELVQGIDRVEEARKQRKVEQHDSLSFGDALRQYVDDDASRDSPLRPRTKADYLSMIRPPSPSKNGSWTRVAGELEPLAGRSIHKLDGAELKALFNTLRKRGETRAGYAMRVLRAVLRYHGVRITDDPFSTTTPKRDRIRIAQTNARSRVIDSKHLGPWWRAAEGVQSGDYFQLLLLTGLRRGELSAIRVQDVDLTSDRLVVPAALAKNRREHVVYLSKPARAIVARRIGVRLPFETLFDGALDPRKSLVTIVKQSGVTFSAHDCRRTFVSIAAGRLPGYVVKRLANHSGKGDVTAAHYVVLNEETLRDAWQAVADYVLAEVRGSEPKGRARKAKAKA